MERGDVGNLILDRQAGEVVELEPERMFDRFYRADPSRSGAAGGVGLGLAISRELTLAMNGKLWADVDGEGVLRVHLSLPLTTQHGIPDY